MLSNSGTRLKPGLSFYLTMFVVVIATMILHEIVHWIAGTALGYEMYFQLTKAGLVEGGWRSDFDYALAMGMSAIFIPNDEARVSLFLELDWWVVPLVFVVPLLVLTVWASRALKFGFVVNFLCYVTVSLAFTLVVFADGQLAGFDGPSLIDPFLPEGARFGG